MGLDNSSELQTQQNRPSIVHEPKVQGGCQPSLRQDSGHQKLLNLPQLLTLDHSKHSGIWLICRYYQYLSQQLPIMDLALCSTWIMLS